MKFAICLLLAALIGTAGAYAAINQKYGDRTGLFGPMAYRGEVTARNAMRLHEESLPDTLPVATTPEGTEHDFGIMQMGEKGEHLFKIRNEGEEPLTLRQGASTCKCTLGTPESGTLQPGEETNVRLEWTVSTTKDEFSQTAEIITNDPRNVAIRLVVSGQVVRELKMVPEVISLGEVAAGEPIQTRSKIFSYLPYRIDVQDLKFSGDRMNELGQIDIQEFDPSQDGLHANAKQAFDVKIDVKPGLRQGPVHQDLWLTYRPVAGDPGAADAPDEAMKMDWQITGRIVGALSMIPNPKLSGRPGGGWVYDFGRIEADDELVGKAFVTLKGSENDSTKLSIGRVTPEGVVGATLEDPIGEAGTALYRLSIELKPGENPVARLGKDPQDYGSVVIESDNPKVPPMTILLKFAIPSADQRAAAQEAAAEEEQP